MSESTKKNAWGREVAAADGGTRLDKFWARELADEGVSRGRIKAWIEAGLALVDGTPVTKGKHKLMGYESLTISAAKADSGDDGPQSVAGELAVVFEDEHVVVIDKDAGVTTHPAPGEPGPTLVNFALHRWPDIAGDVSGMDGQRPGIVHRLDKDTSGLIAVARTEADRLALASDFAERRVSKVYLAIVHGRPEQDEGMIEAPIGRDPVHKTRMAVVEKGGREARSSYRVLWTGPRGLASLVAVRIFTGRTHQIRVHMAHLGHPLLGDATYGSRQNAEWSRRSDKLADLAPRQMLHAFFLSFLHPHSGKRTTLWKQPPEDFRALLSALPRASLRVGIVGMPGCGKSTLLDFLRQTGVPTFSADACVAELYAPGGDGASMLSSRFGGKYNDDNGGVDKPKLFAAMRESDGVRREVMDMIHPMVRHACEEFFVAHRDVPAVFAEIPLLLEGNWPVLGIVDHVVGVSCPREKRTGELREKRGLDEDTLALFDSWQWPEADKLKACDLVLPNDSGLKELQDEADRLVEWAETMVEQRDAEFDGWLDSLWPGLAETFTTEGDGK